MKTYWTTIWNKRIQLLMLAFLFSGCITAKKDLPSGAAVVKPAEFLKSYLAEFEESVKTHNKDKVMEMLDPAYVSEQHDNFLNGNTDQFLSEFFNAKFEEIKKLKFITHYSWRDIHWVKYIVITKNDKKTVTWSIQKQDEEYEYKYGLVGAVG